jgi:hypothetical protein
MLRPHLFSKPTQIKCRRIESGDFSAVADQVSKIERNKPGPRSHVEAAPTLADTKTREEFDRHRTPNSVLEPKSLEFALVHPEQVVAVLVRLRHDRNIVGA